MTEPQDKWDAMLDTMNASSGVGRKAVGYALEPLLAAVPSLPDLVRGNVVAVPREPTEAMLAAAGDAFFDATVAHVPGDLAQVNQPFQRFYRAMIAAAEKHP